MHPLILSALTCRPVMLGCLSAAVSYSCAHPGNAPNVIDQFAGDRIVVAPRPLPYAPGWRCHRYTRDPNRCGPCGSSPRAVNRLTHWPRRPLCVYVTSTPALYEYSQKVSSWRVSRGGDKLLRRPRRIGWATRRSVAVLDTSDGRVWSDGFGRSGGPALCGGASMREYVREPNQRAIRAESGCRRNAGGRRHREPRWYV